MTRSILWMNCHISICILIDCQLRASPLLILVSPSTVLTIIINICLLISIRVIVSSITYISIWRTSIVVIFIATCPRLTRIWSLATSICRTLFFLSYMVKRASRAWSSPRVLILEVLWGSRNLALGLVSIVWSWASTGRLAYVAIGSINIFGMYL